MEKKYVIKNFEDGTYLQQDREGWGEDFTMCEFDSLEEAEDARTALDGWKWKMAMWDLDQKLRGTTKYAASLVNPSKDNLKDWYQSSPKLKPIFLFISI